MHYSSFPGRIYVEKTPKQCGKSSLPPENQKAVREEVKTQVPGWMTDKWTMGSSNGGLYNGISPPEEGGGEKERRKKKHKEITTVASGKIQPRRKHLI